MWVEEFRKLFQRLVMAFMEREKRSKHLLCLAKYFWKEASMDLQLVFKFAY